jgi:sporulation protein YlmC with PRC-barrel domain
MGQTSDQGRYQPSGQTSDQGRNQQTGQNKDTYNHTSATGKNCQVFSKLKGAEVKSSTGENLGRLEDLVIDQQSGKVTFAILGKGGVLSVGEKRLPVPWQALTIDSDKHLSLNVDKQKMQTAPTVNSDYSELDNPDQVVAIYKFYEIEPPAVGGAIQSPGGAGTGSDKYHRDSDSLDKSDKSEK